MDFNWKNEVMLVTGAGSGLGLALALKAGELGATVILIARNKERLAEAREEVAKNTGTAFDFSFDLQDVDKIQELYRRIIIKTDKTPTILINNVGYQVMGFVQNTPVKVYLKNYRVNTLAPIALIQCVLPDMLKQKKGVIANIYSSIMYRAFPGVSSYCASKKALGAIHESLKAELSGTPVRTLCVRPGSFRSNYWQNTDVGNRIIDFTHPVMSEARDPSHVADKICKAIETGKDSVDLSTFKDKVGHHLSYWAPGLLNKIIVSRNSKLLAKRQAIIKGKTEIVT